MTDLIYNSPERELAAVAVIWSESESSALITKLSQVLQVTGKVAVSSIQCIENQKSRFQAPYADIQVFLHCHGVQFQVANLSKCRFSIKLLKLRLTILVTPRLGGQWAPVYTHSIGLHLKLIVFYWLHFQVFLLIMAAFFPSSSGFIINGGNFTSFNFQTEDDGPSIQDFLSIPSLAIDDTEYSRNTSTKEKKKTGLGVRQFSEASQEASQ